MTDPDGHAATPPTVAADPPPDALAAGRICPYLLAAAGWRSPTPAREHRCTAVEPGARLAAEKQRRLCLTGDHVTCSTFVAASDARWTRTPDVRARPGRPIARTAPVVLDRSRSLAVVPRSAGARRWSQIGLVTLMVLALVAILVARSGGSAGGPPGGAGSSATPSLATPSAATPSAPPSPSESARTATPSTTPAATETTGATARPSATAEPTTTASPSTARTYTVKRGDTLSAISARFGTTVAAIQRLNSIADASKIRVGQVLRIP